MANPEHLEIVKRGADAIREWRAKNRHARFDLSKADLSEAHLHRADLVGADLGGADLAGANLSWANLIEANLSRADLSKADLIGADLIGADLRRAYLHRADLSRADLSRADLSRADLSGAGLSEAHLHRAYLHGADLTRANLRQADLAGADMKGARIVGTMFGDVDLTVAKSIETVIHHGPSYVDAHSLMRSAGRIPDVFLRGCGFLPWQISDAKLYDPGLTAEQFAEIQYRVFQERNRGPLCIGGVFISYSRADAKFVDKVYQRLEKEGIPTWLDRHDMVAGPLQKQVMRAIRLNDVVLLVLSEASINSDWVENELDMARRKEKEEKRDVLCPVALDEAWKPRAIGLKAKDMETDDRALWRTLTRKHILDFSAWKTKAFDGQFDKLLRGMKIYYESKKA